MTHVERISMVLRKPGWHSGQEFGPSFHKAASRISELNAKGWNIESRKCKGSRIHEYRMTGVM